MTQTSTNLNQFESMIKFVDFNCHSCDKVFKHRISLRRRIRIIHKNQTTAAIKTPVHGVNVRDGSVNR